MGCGASSTDFTEELEKQEMYVRTNFEHAKKQVKYIYSDKQIKQQLRKKYHQLYPLTFH